MRKVLNKLRKEHGDFQFAQLMPIVSRALPTTRGLVKMAFGYYCRDSIIHPPTWVCLGCSTIFGSSLIRTTGLLKFEALRVASLLATTYH
jgi:hypothetical protein